MITYHDPWQGIAKPITNQLSARGSELVWYAVDDVGCPHLLISVSRIESSQQLFSTRGLTAKITELDPEGGPRGKWIDIACLDPTNREPFALLAKDIVCAIEGLTEPARDLVVSILERWRWFWTSKPDIKPLSNNEAIGLLAELWFFRYWLSSPATVRWWRGPLGDRHDFVHPDISIEVKATQIRGDSEATHIISHIDQLDNPSTGSLMLFSLAVSPDTLSTYSLTSLVDEIDSWMLDTAYIQIWRERIHQAGWSPVHANKYRDTYRIVQQCLYRIDEDFPRIIRSSFVGGDLPVGVTELTYTINPAYVARTHQVSSEPSQVQELLFPMRNPAL